MKKNKNHRPLAPWRHITIIEVDSNEIVMQTFEFDMNRTCLLIHKAPQETGHMNLIDKRNSCNDSNEHTRCDLNPLFDFTSLATIIQSLHVYHGGFLLDNNLAVETFYQPKPTRKKRHVRAKRGSSVANRPASHLVAPCCHHP